MALGLEKRKVNLREGVARICRVHAEGRRLYGALWDTVCWPTLQMPAGEDTEFLEKMVELEKQRRERQRK